MFNISIINFMKLMILILTIFFINTNLIAQWKPCNKGLGGMPGDTTSHGAECFVVDGDLIFGGIDDGVYMTTNNGEYWIAKNNGLNKTLMGPVVSSLTINGNNIFAGTLGDGIYLSTDKGENWVRRSNGLPFYVFGLDTIFSLGVNSLIISGDIIFAGSDKGFYLSIDNGANWIPKNNGLPNFDSLKRDIYSMVVSGNNIYAGTRYGVYMSTDNGENWSARNNGMENMNVYSLAINGNNIYAATCFNGIYLSTNNGNEWINIVRKDTCMDILLLKDKYIFSAGGFYISSDGGFNWRTHESGLTYLGIISLIINGEYIFAGTDSEGIFRAKLSDLGITDVKEQEQTNGIKIFPNPATDEFRLRFQTPTETTVQLSVFDLLGNLVLSQTLQSTEGMNEKNINCEKLPQGYYYVKINVNENVQSIPLMIIK